MNQMSQQNYSSTRKGCFRGSLPVEQAAPPSHSFPGLGPWEQNVYHGPRTSQLQFQNSMESYLEPDSTGFFSFDATSNTLPMTHADPSLTPEGTDGIYLYEACLDAPSQYGSSKTSPNDSGNSQYIESWNHGMHIEAERSAANLSSIIQLGTMPEAAEFGNFNAPMPGAVKSQVPWKQGTRTSPSQNSSVTGSLSASVAMDFSRRTSMTYLSPSMSDKSSERAQLDTHSNPVAAAALASGTKTANGRKSKSSVKGTKEKSRKTSTITIETPNTSPEHSMWSPKLNLSMEHTADEEASSSGMSFANEAHKPNPGSTIFQTTHPRQGAQRLRNRKAATKCREKTKAAIAKLQATESAITLEHMKLSRTVAELRGQVLALKNELLLHGNCDCEVIQQYLRNAARIIGEAALANHSPSRGDLDNSASV